MDYVEYTIKIPRQFEKLIEGISTCLKITAQELIQRWIDQDIQNMLNQPEKCLTPELLKKLYLEYLE